MSSNDAYTHLFTRESTEGLESVVLIHLPDDNPEDGSGGRVEEKGGRRETRNS